MDFYKAKAKELNIQLIPIPELNKAEKGLRRLIKGKDINNIDIIILRYTFWLERNLLHHLKQWKSKERKVKCYEHMDHYHFHVNSGVFFSQTVVDRIALLYKNFQEHDMLAARCAHELYPPEELTNVRQIPKEAFRETFYNCKLNPIQVAAHLEYSSRLAILKNTVDYILFDKYKKNLKIGDTYNKFLGFSKSDLLPPNFKEGLSKLKNHKCYNRYPVFWQWFTYVFGGFIMLDYKEKEYALLAEKTGIEVSEIDNALSAFDILFPTYGGWMRKNNKSNILESKLFPMPFRGIGANYRRLMYSPDSLGRRPEYEDLGMENNYTFNDLIKWNNLAVEVITSFNSENG